MNKNPDSIFIAANPFNILFDINNDKNDKYDENNKR